MKDCFTFDARNVPVFNSFPKRNGEDKAQLEHNIMKLLVASMKNYRTAIWKEVAVINLFSTDCPFCLGFFSSSYSVFLNARNVPVFNSLTKRNGEDKAQLEHNIMKLVVASMKNYRTAIWKEVAVINLFSTDCPFCLGFFSSSYSVFLNARNVPVFNSLTKRNGEDEAQLEHNIMKLVVASSCGAASHA